jgi:hypothetical protein
MKLQFSLATLLVCLTVFSVVAGICASRPVDQFAVGTIMDQEPMRTPNVREVFWRMAYWEPPILAATLGVLWTIRRLKSRRHNESPVG